MGKASQNYGVSVWCHSKIVKLFCDKKQFYYAARHMRAHSALTPAGEGWYSIYLPRRDGWLS